MRPIGIEAKKPLEPGIECENPGCGERFDPIGCRWRCPHCGFRSNCCEGEAL